MRAPAWLVLSLLLAGCVAPAQSRFPADVATALREHSMRRLETRSLLVYYPSHRREEALRVAERVEACAGVLRAQAKIHNAYADQKMVLVVPDLPLNNAFVAPPAVGNEAVSVIPTSNTLDFTSELGMPPDPSFVGCHEIAHYVHMLQIEGTWGWVNKWFGHVLTPQVGLDAWFIEGLATYYESRLQPGTGRMAWPVWRGMFHAGVAGSRIGGGDLSPFHRPFHWGNHYLVGSHFVEFIAERYGEHALWRLVANQGDAFWFPLGVALRWKDATGKSLPALIDEFADFAAAQYPARPRPASQRMVRHAGTVARYAASAGGREALISASGDEPTTLRVYDGGRLIAERRLTEILPPRTLAIASPILTSGLSFTGDGRELYFVAIDAGVTLQEARLLRYRVDDDELDVVLPRIGGVGGGISADGATYYYGFADGDRRHLAALDVATGAARMVRKAGPRGYYGPAAPSPDGTRVAAAVFDGQRFVVRILAARSGRTLAEVSVTGAVYDPSWVDDGRLVLLAEQDGRFQVHLYDIAAGTLSPVSDAPYVAFQPRAIGGAVRFLNRTGWSWTIDEVPLAPLPGVPAPAPDQPLPELPYAGPGGASHAGAPAVSLDPLRERSLDIRSDRAYSQLDNLFYPSLRTPLLGSSQENAVMLGLSLAGGDRLSFHRWTVFGLYDVVGRNVSGGVHYATALAAPFDVRLELERFAWNEALEEDGEVEAGRLRGESTALVAIGRTVRTTRLELGLLGVEDVDREHPVEALRERRLAGPRLSFDHAALEATPYAGARRGVALAGSAAYFDRALSTLKADITDVGGALGIVSPLPLGKRHTLALSVRGRRLLGSDRDAGLLTVGGSAGLFADVWRRSDRPEHPDVDPLALSPQVEFHETLRGFEDAPFATDRVAIGEVTYRYPIILDAGFASTAYLLPSWFFRQLDLELFAAGATDSVVAFDTRRRLAAGGSLSLAMSVWLVPVTVRYQLARRLTDDEAQVHSVAVGLGL